jgi:putative CocE/NonD family hydrolase
MLAEGGAFQIGLVQPWVLGLAASDPGTTGEHRARAAELGAAWAETLRAPPGLDPVAELLPTYGDWRRGRVTAPSVHGRYDELETSVFQVAGWYDIFCESALRHWQGMVGSSRPHRLVIGPWSHSNGLSNLHPEVDFGDAANGVYAGVTGGALAWMRQVLDGQDARSGISCFVMNEGWRELASWPPPTTKVVLRFGAGRLCAAWTEEGADELRHDPDNPVPTRGGRVLGPFLPMPGPVDQRSLELRDDVLVYNGEPTSEGYVLMGMIRARVSVQSTAPSLDVAVKLCDVHPDGRSINVVDSVRRIDATPGTWQTVHVDVGSTAYLIRPGHALRLMVSGSNFPRFDVNPGTAEELGTAAVLRPAVHRVAWGSELHLPVEPVTAMLDN